ncbi:Copia protein [Artemisia annua]|uniref:Copia protein n=1 Tax=Artemisia annua TaxID=35608 RepID=A0A2U1LUD9_ARTAN|nr:Copia protein [Artemisia annua]
MDDNGNPLKKVDGFQTTRKESQDQLVSELREREQIAASKLTEAEYRCLFASICKVIRVCSILSELKIASNPTFYEKTNHFEIDVHVVREKVSIG